MKPISLDIRNLIIAAKKRKETNNEIIIWLGVGNNTINKIWRLYRQTGSVEPKIYKGRPSKLSDEMRAAILTKIKHQSDVTLETIIDDLVLPIKKSQLSRWLNKVGLTFKKKRYIPKNNKEKM